MNNSLDFISATAAIRAAKISQAHDNGTEVLVSDEGFGLEWKDLPKATWYLLSNPSYLCISITDGLEFFMIVSISTFLPKIIANQFGATATFSAIATGEYCYV